MGTITVSQDQDGAAIHDACQELAGDPEGRVEIEAGRYEYDEDIEIPDDVTVDGEDEDSVLLVATGRAAVRSDGRPTVGVTVKNLTIDGNEQGEWGLRLPNPRGVRVENVTVKNAGVRENAGERNAGGMSARVNSDNDAGDVVFEDCTAINCAAVSIDCGGRAPSAGPITVRKCRVKEPNRSNRFTHGISVESTHAPEVDNCRLVTESDAQLAINVNATTRATVDDCYVEGWRQGTNNFNARKESYMTVRDCEYYDIHNEGVLVQPDGDDSIGNEVRRCEFDGADTAINGKHGGVIDTYNNKFYRVNRAIKVKDASVPVSCRGNDVYEGTKADSRTLHITGDGGDLEDQMSHISDNYTDAYSGYMVVGIPANVTENTIMGTWNEALGDGGSIKAGGSGGVYHGNVLGGKLKYSNNDITRDNETNML